MVYTLWQTNEQSVTHAKLRGPKEESSAWGAIKEYAYDCTTKDGLVYAYGNFQLGWRIPDDGILILVVDEWGTMLGSGSPHEN